MKFRKRARVCVCVFELHSVYFLQSAEHSYLNAVSTTVVTRPSLPFHFYHFRCWSAAESTLPYTLSFSTRFLMMIICVSGESDHVTSLIPSDSFFFKV